MLEASGQAFIVFPFPSSFAGEGGDSTASLVLLLLNKTILAVTAVAG